MHFRSAGRNHDDATAVTHPAAGLLQGEKDPSGIDVENVIVICLRVFDQRLYNMNAGVGDDDVETAHRLLCFVE